jgi:hypothetical protein
MKELHCPACGTPFVRVTSESGLLEKLLNRFHIFNFRCQLCTTQFRAHRPGKRQTSQEFDRRQYRRLRANIAAALTVEQPAIEGLITDVSMGGCTMLAATNLPRGTFVEVLLRAPSGLQDIKVDAAMICSVRPESVGVKFLEFQPDDKQRMGQLVLDLLATQNIPPSVGA